MADLPRKLTFVDGAALLVGSVIGSGIFVVPSLIAQRVPEPGLVIGIWIVSGLLVLCGALTLAELGAMLPQPGGLYVYMREAYGPFWAFLYGWTITLVAIPGAIAALTSAFLLYLELFVPMTLWVEKTVGIGILLGLALVNTRSARHGAGVQNLFTALKVAGLVGLVGLALVTRHGDAANFLPLGPEHYSGGLVTAVGLAMISTLFAYDGWQNVSFVAGEIRDPQRNIPRSIILGVLIVIVVYVSASLAYIYVLGQPRIATSERVAADAMSAMIGPTGATLISLTILCSTFGAISANVLSGPRVFFAMGRDGVLFPQLADIHPRYDTPANAIWALAIWAGVLTLTGGYEHLITMSGFVNWIFFTMVVLSVIVLRRRHPEWERPYRVAGYPFTVVVFVLVSSAFVVNTLVGSARSSLMGLGLLLLGVPFYLRRRGRGVIPALMLLLLFFLALSACSGSTPQAPYDLLITGGSVIDGDGTPASAADIGIRDGRIASIGSLRAAPARQRIDASGLTVAPGFIDMHNHSDYTILAEPKSESMIRQGVTTMVLGESRSAGPVKPGVDDGRRAGSDGATVDWTTLGGYFEKLERQHTATNIASYVGEEQVWTYVKGYDQSPATPRELEAMKTLVAQAMEDGAMGLSTALLQPPSSLATTENLVELATIAKQYGGIYSSHIRDEGEGVFRAVDEAIQVGKRAGIPVDIIHMKIAHQKLWGRVNDVIAVVQKARDAGFDIQANVYPYTAGQNNLSSIIPPWAHDGGRERMLQRLRDPAARRRMHNEVLHGLPNWYNHYLATGGGWAGMLLVSLKNKRNEPFQGKRMSELIESRGGDPVDALFDVLVEEDGSVPTVFFHHSEEDMQLVMKQPWTSIGSDGSAVNPDGPTGRSHPHPRYYGTFPRVLGRYVRELKVLTLPEAVKKMTSMNADKIGITDRGRLREGMWADVTIFDQHTVIDRATFEKPHQYPVGITYVIVNGAVTIDHARHTGALAGRVIYGPGKK